MGNTRVTFRDGINKGDAYFDWYTYTYVDPNAGNTTGLNDGTITSADIMQINSYYPFGLNMEGNWNGAAGNNKYAYNGKEWNDDFGLGWNDYGARFYTADAPRWVSIDPLAEKYSSFNPYAYTYNNPIGYFDIDGREGVPVIMIPSSFGAPTMIYPSLQKHQWHTIGGSAEPSTFNKAAIYNTTNNSSWAYTNISERHDYYAWADRQVSSKSRWFAAAEIVTRGNSVGAADGINLWWLSDRAEKFLQEGNKFLFSYNMSNFKSIQNGTLNSTFTDVNGTNVSFTGLSGKALDYALVQFEQTKVQSFINQYQKSNPNANMNEILSSINYSMGSSFAPSEIKKVMSENFNTDKGQPAFNFGNYEHRVILGQKIVDQLHK